MLVFEENRFNVELEQNEVFRFGISYDIKISILKWVFLRCYLRKGF